MRSCYTVYFDTFLNLSPGCVAHSEEDRSVSNYCTYYDAEKGEIPKKVKFQKSLIDYDMELQFTKNECHSSNVQH